MTQEKKSANSSPETRAEGRSLLLRGGQYLDTSDWAMRKADLLISDGRVVQIKSMIVPPANCEVVEVSGSIVIPGFMNAHTHANNNLIKGSVDTWTLEMLLMFGRVYNRNRTPEDEYLSTALGAIEMLRTGTTTVFDLFIQYPGATVEGIEAVMEAYRNVGVRAIVSPAIADRSLEETIAILEGTEGSIPSFDPSAFALGSESVSTPSTEQQLSVLSDVLSKHQKRDDSASVQLAVSPTIPILCTDELLVGCAEIARRYGTLVHTHLLETRFQASAAEMLYACPMGIHLSRLGLLDERFVGAHGVWLTEQELELIGESRGTLVYLPASNLKLGSGVPRVSRWLRSGMRVGIGTDGCSSSDNLNMLEAMRLGALLSRVEGEGVWREWLGARDVLWMAFQGAGLSEAVSGTIAQGATADLVVMDLDSVYFTPLNDLPQQIVYCETGVDVKTVVVGGEVRYLDGKVLGIDEVAIREAAAEAGRRLRSENSRIGRQLVRVLSDIERVCAYVARGKVGRLVR